jgi:hypothetical protein
MKDEGNVIRPRDIPVKANEYQTYLSPVVSDLALLFLKNPPLRIDANASPPGFVESTELNREIQTTRKNARNLLKKYEEE